jgi:hypothetical protein
MLTSFAWADTQAEPTPDLDRAELRVEQGFDAVTGQNPTAQWSQMLSGVSNSVSNLKGSAAQVNLAYEQWLRDAGALVLQPAFHPSADTALDPLTMIQSFYGSAERIARARGCNPDEPKLLAKVTRTV